MNLPLEFQDKMKMLLKEDYETYQKSFEDNIGQTLRANQLKTEPAELFRRFHTAWDLYSSSQGSSSVQGQDLIKSVPWCETGAYYQGGGRLSLHPFYQAGLYYLQEPSAMAPAAFLPVEPGDKVLDLCAAPGGKTTALGAKLNGKGILIANDISISRCRALLKNVEMAGIPNVQILCENPEKLSAHFPEYFDKILVDAPCSGEGMFRRDPSMIKSWSPEEVEHYSFLQKEILIHAAAMLKPGGCLLYSTCTYSPEENEQVVETLLKQETFSLLPLPMYPGVDEGHPEWSLSGDPSLRLCRRFWNHRVRGEGQFAALIRKNSTAEENRIAEKKRTGRAAEGKVEKTGAKQLPEEFTEFMSHVASFHSKGFFRRDLEQRLFFSGERIFLLPRNAPDLFGLRVVSSGLHLGNCKKKRFEPGQALAMALSPDQYDNVLTLPLEDERIGRYLRCETIELTGEEHVKDGWILICVENYPLGWGKVSLGRVKNKYPAGWRRQ